MVLIFYVLINLFGFFFFVKMKKNLHILEILVYWMVSTYIYQNLSALCYMNFKTFIIPDQLIIEFTHVLNRIVLFPLIMVTFLNYFLCLNTFYSKLLSVIGYLIILTGVEWMSHFLGVLIHVHWKIWWSFAFWLLALLILIGFMKFFRKVLYEGELNI